LRAFLSYDIEDPSFITKVRSVQHDLDLTGADLKLVDPELLHFTIRFLGEIDEQDKAQIISTLKGKVEGFDLDLTFRGLGTFPDERRISVVWVGIDPSSGAKLEKQAREVNALLESIRTLHRDASDRFSPHITIARVRSGRNKDKLVDYVRSHKTDELGATKIGSLRLKLSHLTPAGPEYSDLHIFEK
jgi:RNA 2',3'-cyclic 3'-phosphodiesterase